MLSIKNLKGISAGSLATVAAALSAVPALAAETTETTETISVQALEQRLLILERQLEIQKEEAETKAKDGSGVGANDKGFNLKSNKGDFDLKFRALVHVDGRFYADDNSTRFADGFELRRVRPTFDGTLGKWVSFRLTPELAGAGATVLDAYFDLALHPSVKLRAGRFKTPVGLERYFYSTAALNHVEFGLPTALVPNRDVGLQVLGDVFSGTLNYAVAFTNGATDGQDASSPRDLDNRHEVSARLFAEPFKNDPGFFQGLGIGIGTSHGSKLGTAANPLTAAYRTAGQQAFFTYDATTLANGEQTRLSPQAYFYRNNYGALAEYVSSSQKLREAAVTGDIKNTAWQVSTSYVLTGEDASFKGVKPRNPYKPGADGWGAVEIAARIGELSVDEEAFQKGFATPAAGVQRRATAWGLGVNWYLTNNIKAVLNYDETSFDASEFAGPGVVRETEKAIFTRLQLNY